MRTSSEQLQVGGVTLALVRPAEPEALLDEDAFADDEFIPYWADVWPSSIILAGKLLELDGAGRSALELGCGVGLSTLAAMTAEFDVLSTDYYQDAIDVTRANVFRNLGLSAQTRLVDWRHVPKDIGTFDLVFASDVLYEKEYALLLPIILCRILGSEGRALIADPGRVAAPMFIEACEAHGLVIREKETRPFEAGEIKQRIDLYQIGRT